MEDRGTLNPTPIAPPLVRWFNAYHAAWIVGASVVATNHFFRAEAESASTRWAASGGWQRELGVFLLGLAFLNAQALRTGDSNTKRLLLRTALFLWPALTANHVAALATGEGPVSIHIGASVLNTAATAIALALLRADRRATAQASPRFANSGAAQ